MMESLPSLSDAFQTAANAVTHFVGETLYYTVKVTFAHAVTGAVVYLATKMAMDKKFREGNFRDDNVTISFTRYPSLGKDEQRKEQFEQNIINAGEFELEKIYSGKMGRRVVKYIQKAAKRCTDENPVVFLNLLDSNLIHETGATREHLENYIKSKWISYFSSITNGHKSIFYSELDKKTALNFDTYYPVLVFENGAEKKQFRVLMFSENQLKSTFSFPEADSVLIDGVKDSANNQMERLGTNKRVLELLRQDSRLRSLCGIRVYDNSQGPNISLSHR